MQILFYRNRLLDQTQQLERLLLRKEVNKHLDGFDFDMIDNNSFLEHI